MQLSIVADCLAVLKHFESATRQISGQKHISGSIVIRLTSCINTAMQKVIVKSPLAARLKDELQKQVDKRLNPLEKHFFVAAATIIDPRFKKKIF